MPIAQQVLTENLHVGHAIVPPQNSDFLNAADMCDHFTGEVVLGSGALIIGKKSAVKTQRKQRFQHVPFPRA